MEKKKIILLLLLIVSVVIAIFFFKKGEVLEIISPQEKISAMKVYNIHYRIMILNYTIDGETICVSGSKIADLLRYNLQVDLSKSLRRKVRFTFNLIDNKLVCFNDFCGDWEIRLNNKTVLLNDSCEEGNLELRFLG